MATIEEVRGAIAQLKEAFEQEGVWKLFPLELMSVGAGLGMAPMVGLVLRGVRASSVEENPRLEPEERLLLEAAASPSPDLTWTELWLQVTGREEDIQFLADHRFNRRAAEETSKVLKRISNIFCFLWEHPKLFESTFPEENSWWSDFFGDCLAGQPLAYARSLAPTSLLPALEDVMDDRVAREFRYLCYIIHDFLKTLDLGEWQLRPLSEIQFRRLASSIQAEGMVAASVGIMMGLGGIPTRARNYSFSFLEKPGDSGWSFDEPIELDQMVLLIFEPRLEVVVREKEIGEFHEALISRLREAKEAGKIRRLHLRVRSADWAYWDPNYWESIPIGKDDEDPQLWRRELMLVGGPQHIKAPAEAPAQ